MNFDIDNSLVQRCGHLLSTYFIVIFFCTIGICKHVDVTSIGDTYLDIVNVEGWNKIFCTYLLPCFLLGNTKKNSFSNF
jgi:hypothetical protein